MAQTTTINNPDGTSRVIRLNPATNISEIVDNYSLSNGNGRKTSSLVDYTNNSSQVWLYNPSSGIATAIDNYSGTNASGTWTSTSFYDTDGTSQLWLYNPSSGITKAVDNFSNSGAWTSTSFYDTDGTSQLWLYNPSSGITKAVDNFSNSGAWTSTSFYDTDGTSQLWLYNPSSGITKAVDNFSNSDALTSTSFYDTDGTSQLWLYNPSSGITKAVDDFSNSGALTSTLLDSTGGTSQVVQYNTSNVTSHTITLYSGPDQTGPVTEKIVDYNDGKSSVTTYDTSGAKMTDYSGPDGTGSVIPGSDPDDDGDTDTASDTSGLVAGAHTRMNVVGQYDLSHGYIHAAESANAAWNRATSAIASSESPIGAATAAPLEGAKWESPSVTWSFASGLGTPTNPFSVTIQAQYQSAIEGAIAAWGAASGIRFQEVADSTASDIRIGWGLFDTSESGVIGYTTFHHKGDQMEPGVIVRLEDPSQDPLVNGSDPTYAGTEIQLGQVALHEIGHAIGLAESTDPTSIMFPLLGQSNPGLNAADLSNVASLCTIRIPRRSDQTTSNGY